MRYLPILTIPTAPTAWDNIQDIRHLDWDDVPRLPPFLLAETGVPAEQQTAARLCADNHRLYAHFECEDRDIWGTWYRETEDQLIRKRKIYDEEVIELFIGVANEESAPISCYTEFEVSPNGVLLDVAVTNPNTSQDDIKINFDWHCPNVMWHAERHDRDNRWTATLAIPWAALTDQRPIPTHWRGNCYRIERPRDGTKPEFSCWSPTMTDPAQFHQPAWFGTFIRPT
ncbi:MAG: hypothetical protein ACI9EW_001089 [Cellvibrionaceae bacterium]|jgi:hypothetical protein